MKTPEPGIWHRTSPFAILFFIGRILRLIAKNAWQSIAPVFAFLVAYQGDLVTKLTLGGIGIAVIIAVASLLSYWFFRFQIRDDSILIRQGVLKKRQLDIKFDRIQGINTQQNPVYRALKLVTVNFDTAGSAGNEGNLPAVTREFAESLRQRIGRQRHEEPLSDAVEQAEPDALIRLGWRDMIRIGLADYRALIVFAFIGPLLEQIGDEIDTYIERAAWYAVAVGIPVDRLSSVSIVIAVVGALILILMLVSVAAAFLRYHNFEMRLDDRTLRSHGGLVTRHEHSMDLGKIQTVRLQQGIVETLQKRFKMTLRQAIASDKQGRQKVFTIPTVAARQADTLRQAFLAPEAGALSQDPRSDSFRPISPYYMRSRILYIGLFPALIAAGALLVPSAGKSLMFLLWLPVVGAVSYQYWRRAGFVHDDDEIVRRSGLLGYRTVGLLFRKVQRVTVTQSRYQRRKGLASLRMYMASGSVRVPYIEHAMAKQLRDYILYKVESSDKAWH